MRHHHLRCHRQQWAGLIEPVSLEMDAESDDELDALSEMYDPENKGDGTHRYTLLRELWSSAR